MVSMNPDEFGRAENEDVSHSRVLPTKDRILYWPIILACFCFWFAAKYHYSEPGVDVAPTEIYLLWLISAGFGVISCLSAIFERAWRRFLSAMVLPLSILVVAFAWGH